MLVEATGPRDWSEVLARLSASFPDISWRVHRTLAQDDHVWVETTMSGTHEGAFFAIAPTGRRFEVRQVHMLRLQGGQIQEHWAVRDDLGLLVQLGAVEPRPPRAPGRASVRSPTPTTSAIRARVLTRAGTGRSSR